MSPESLQLRGAFETQSKLSELQTQNEDLLKRLADFEQLEARLKLDLSQLRDRLSRVEQDSDLRVDELMHENDNLVRQCE